MPSEKDLDQLKRLGMRIREAREKLKMSREDFSQRIGKTVDSISRYESGTRAMNITDLPLLSEVLDVPMEYFFTESKSHPAYRLYGMAHYISTKEPEEIQDMILQAVLFLTGKDNKLPLEHDIGATFVLPHATYGVSVGPNTDSPNYYSEDEEAENGILGVVYDVDIDDFSTE